MKESPQDVITLHQQVEQQKTEIDQLRRGDDQKSREISQLKIENDQHKGQITEKDAHIGQLKFEVDQLNQQLVSVICFVIITIYGIAILVLHKECTNTTSSQST